MSTTQLSRAPAADAADAVRNDGSANSVAKPDMDVTPRHKWYPPLKLVGEYIAAAILSVIAIPIVLFAAILIKLTSRGPVFYLQTRLGRNGRLFRVIKLRTMVHNAEEKTGAVWSGENDPRITRVGQFLRNSHIDEFPQLLNVLLGQMALIGPRPERPEIVEQLEWQVSSYRQRLQVRPGITGLAQLKLPADSCIDGVRRKLLHDLYYVRYHSPWLDVRILFVTGWLLTKTLFCCVWSLIALPTTDSVNNRLEPIVGRESDLIAAARDVEAD